MTNNDYEKDEGRLETMRPGDDMMTTISTTASDFDVFFPRIATCFPFESGDDISRQRSSRPNKTDNIPFHDHIQNCISPLHSNTTTTSSLLASTFFNGTNNLDFCASSISIHTPTLPRIRPESRRLLTLLTHASNILAFLCHSVQSGAVSRLTLTSFL